MDTLVLSTLLMNSVGIVAAVVGLALASCLPVRRTHYWLSNDADAAAAKPAAWSRSG